MSEPGPTGSPCVEGDLLRAALRYAERGVSVFPLAPHGKVPAIRKREGGRGFLDATTDPERIMAWWRRRPEANVGVRTGVCFDVLDVDPRHGGAESLAALEREHGALPETPEAETGSGGRHVLFQPHAGLRCSTALVGPGLDVRSAGGYVVAPPSIHPNGRRYRWRIRGIPLAPWPAWLLALAAPPTGPERPRATARVRDDGRGSRYGLAVLRRACEAVATADVGTRHLVLRRRARTVAGYVAGGELGEDLARACLLDAAAEAGLPDREAERTVDWAIESGSARPLAPERRVR